MLNEHDKKWLKEKYPGLEVNTSGIYGLIEFTATYNHEINRFLLLEKDMKDTVGGVRLSGKFKIRIQKRIDTTYSNLPALYIDDMPIIPVHINSRDNSACLCSPFEEDKFLFPEFNFQEFFKQLVLPFLYGQLYYSMVNVWPWLDFSHGSAGLLESYFQLSSPEKAKECVEKLAKDLNWPEIKKILKINGKIKGHILCVCPKKDQIRRCHPNAWKGIQILSRDIKTQGINLP